MTYYHAQSGKYIAAGNPFTLSDIQYPSNWLDLASADDIAALGLAPVVTIETVPENYRFHSRTEQLVGSERIVTWTPFPAEQVTEMVRMEKQAEIDRLERESMVARAVREYMLLDIESKALAAGHTLEELRAAHYGYRKTKELDEQIAALRSAL